MREGAYRQLPATSRERGLAAIGFEMETPGDLEIQPVEGGPVILRCRERRSDGKPVGELEVAVFQAALVIDRDGILEEKVRQGIEAALEAGARVHGTTPVTMPGASGFRADAEIVRPMGAPRPALPFVYAFAMAPHDLGVDGGVLVTVRCASPDWPAADRILRSLRILTRRGKTANDVDAPPLSLPVVGTHDD